MFLLDFPGKLLNIKLAEFVIYFHGYFNKIMNIKIILKFLNQRQDEYKISLHYFLFLDLQDGHTTRVQEWVTFVVFIGEEYIP